MALILSIISGQAKTVHKSSLTQSKGFLYRLSIRSVHWKSQDLDLGDRSTAEGARMEALQVYREYEGRVWG